MNRTQEVFSAVDALNADMRRLLEVLQDAESTGVEIAAAWDNCERRTRELQEARKVAQLTPEENLSVDEKLETTARLNAVALGMIQSERIVLAKRIRTAKDTKKALRGGGFEVSLGESCDVAG